MIFEEDMKTVVTRDLMSSPFAQDQGEIIADVYKQINSSEDNT